MDVEVVGLGVWCDHVTEDQRREDLAGSAWPPEEVEEAFHFCVEEFATLSDGRRLALIDDRGWSSSMGREDLQPTTRGPT